MSAQGEGGDSGGGKKRGEKALTVNCPQGVEDKKKRKKKRLGVMKEKEKGKWTKTYKASKGAVVI